MSPEDRAPDAAPTDAAPTEAGPTDPVRPGVGPLRVVGHIRSPLGDRRAAPRQATADAPAAEVVIDDAYTDALVGVEPGARLVVVTWLHEADRGVLQVHPRGDRSVPARGVFATRAPVRPNPIGLHPVEVTAVEGTTLRVAHLDAVDGTPVLDVKSELRS